VAQAPSIALVLPNLDAGGAEMQLLQLAGFLARGRRRTRIVCLDRRGVLAERLPGGVEVVDLGVPSAKRAIRHLARALAGDDVVVSSLKHVSLAVEAARRLGNRRVLHVVRVANTYSRELAGTSPLRRAAWATALRFLHRGAALAICGSEGVRADLLRVTGASAERVKVIGNPVFDAELLRRADLPTGDAAFDALPGPKLVAAGRLEPQKGFDVLVAAFATAFPADDARLFVLGEGRERDKLRWLAAQLGVGERVFLRGFVANPYPYLARCDAFALSSRYEGLPNVLIEALCLGRSVVATDCASGPREILEAVQAGRLVPVDDVAAMAEALRASVREPPAAAAVERARSLFRREDRLADWAAEIDRLALGFQSELTQPLAR